MLTSPLSGEEAHESHTCFEQCNAKNYSGVLWKNEKIGKMYIKKEKLYERVLVKVKALFECLVNIEQKSEVPKNGEIKLIRKRIRRTANSEIEAKTHKSGPT